MFKIVDFLASEYGWSKDDILFTTSLSEVLRLLTMIQQRKLMEQRLQLSLLHSSNPEKFAQQLDEEMRAYTYKLPSEEFDKAAFERLKNSLPQGTGFRIK